MSQQELDAMKLMEKSALVALATKAGPMLPILHGKDKDLPKTPPVFDEKIMLERNAAIKAKRNSKGL